MTSTETTSKAKRIALADVNSAFHNSTEFTAGNGTLIGVTGHVAKSNLSGGFARKYAHHIISGSYKVLYTVVSRGTVIGWSYTTAGQSSGGPVIYVVIGTHNDKPVLTP